MSFDFDNMDIGDIEYARYIILNLVKDLNVSLNIEEEANGTNTIKYKRLIRDIDATRYAENLIVKKLRDILY